MSGAPARTATRRHRGRLVVVLEITSVVLVAQVVGAWLTGSLALFADAGHMLTDVAGIAIAIVAASLAARPADEARTFGLARLEVLAAALNAVLLLAVAAYVLVEAWRRLSATPEVDGGPMLAFALVGLAANAISLRILHPAQGESLNVRGAYLEVLGDLLGSLAVVVAAIVILVTGWEQADAVASAAIGVAIVPRTWRLFREVVDVLLEATPRGISLAEVRRHMLETDGVEDVHDLHAWTITSGMPVVSAHVVVGEGAHHADVLDRLCRCLGADFDVEHCTFQLETRDRRDAEGAGHA
jgi:cobalt-zinc-cadmium efflux system protein